MTRLLALASPPLFKTKALVSDGRAWAVADLLGGRSGDVRLPDAGSGRGRLPFVGEALKREPDAAHAVLVLEQPALERLVECRHEAAEDGLAAIEDRLAGGRQGEQRRATVARVRALFDVAALEQPCNHVAQCRPAQAA